VTVRLTHIGSPTLLVEAHWWRILSDPTFDPPGRRYSCGWGTSSTTTTGPAIEASDLPPWTSRSSVTTTTPTTSMTPDAHSCPRPDSGHHPERHP
jgi:hypothetical protein